jgi:alkylation response protein AidB-like acyl-CoA dehydrogenase
LLAVEELAAASGTVAALTALAPAAGSDGLAGLRGVAPVAQTTDWQRLVLAAVCLGLGRAARDEALDGLRRDEVRPSGEPEAPPVWIMADAATELDGARLLVYASAEGGQPGAAAVLVFAARAARAAVDAAVRLVGPQALRPGTMLERCDRDIRAAALVAGTEDAMRREAADRLLG